MTTAECLNCKKLGACNIVTAEKLLSKYKCDEWKEALKEQVKAREMVIKAYQKSGISSLLTTTVTED